VRVNTFATDKGLKAIFMVGLAAFLASDGTALASKGPDVFAKSSQKLK
jgi:hypothetical protein